MRCASITDACAQIICIHRPVNTLDLPMTKAWITHTALMYMYSYIHIYTRTHINKCTSKEEHPHGNTTKRRHPQVLAVTSFSAYIWCSCVTSVIRPPSLWRSETTAASTCPRDVHYTLNPIGFPDRLGDDQGPLHQR